MSLLTCFLGWHRSLRKRFAPAEAQACYGSPMERAGSPLADKWELQLAKLALETNALKAEVAVLAAASVEVKARWEAKLRWESQGPPAIARLDFRHIDDDLAML